MRSPSKEFSNQPRHGISVGCVNENFLKAELFTEAFLWPMSPFREKTGVIMFEFGQFHAGDFVRGRDFVEALDRLLGRLPKRWQFGAEIRSNGFLQPQEKEKGSDENGVKIRRV